MLEVAHLINTPRLLVEGTIRDSKLLVVQDQTLKVKIIFLIKAYLKSIVRDEDNYLEHFRYLLYCISEKHNPSCVCVAVTTSPKVRGCKSAHITDEIQIMSQDVQNHHSSGAG